MNTNISKLHTIEGLIQALDKAGINYEYKPKFIGRDWENGEYPLKPLYSKDTFILSFQLPKEKGDIWYHFEHTQNTVWVNFVQRYNCNTGKAIKSFGAEYRLLTKLSNLANN